MSRPNTPPSLIRDQKGWLVLKLKRGRETPEYGQGPHAHHFDASGARVDHHGVPVDARSSVNFRTIRWDLPDTNAPTPSDAPPMLPEALALLARSAKFRQAAEAIQRAGWSIEVARKGQGGGCLKGPQIVSALAPRRSAFVGRLAHDVSLAHALSGPLPIVDVQSPAFAHDNALFLIAREGEAVLNAAYVRDEILADGGPDIGGPGLRGSQVAAFEALRNGSVALEPAKDAIAMSLDGDLVRGFDRARGPRVAQVLVRAFVDTVPLPISKLPAAAVDILERVRALPALTAETVSHALGSQLARRQESPPNATFDTFDGKELGGPFSTAMLRVPARGVVGFEPRLLLTPETAMSHAEFAAWFGRGVPHAVHAGEKPLATVAYPTDRSTIYVTYAVDDTRAVRAVTVHAHVS